MLQLRSSQKRIKSTLIISLICLSAWQPAVAARRALLIGAAAYPNLPATMHLQGPGHDAALMRDMALRQGFAPGEITLLADDVPGAGVPTRQAILDELAHLASVSQPGDLVLVFFAGHGSQQPDDGAHPELIKPDGLSSVILPDDVAMWRSGQPIIPNAITDHEFGLRLEAIRAAGAFVWAVLDSCHSAMMIRGGNPHERPRFIRPEALGLPAEAMAEAMTRTGLARGAASMRGTGSESEFGLRDEAGLVGFFAAQSYETTPEMPMQAGGAVREVHGLFTWELVGAIERRDSPTYGQLGQRILQRYGLLGRSAPTPLFVGQLDAGVLGAKAPGLVRQWPIERGPDGISIAAGGLAGLGNGSVMAILADPAADTQTAPGYLRVQNPGLFRSVLTPVAYAGRRAVSGIAPGSYARLVDRALTLTLTVALPQESPAPAVQPLRAALAALRASPPDRLRVTFVAPDAPADIRLAFEADHLLFRPGSGDTGTSVLALGADAPALQGRLENMLFQIARVRTLLEVSAALPATGFEPLDVRIDLTTPADAGPRRARCDPQGPSTSTRPRPEALPGLRQCDVLGFTIENTGTSAEDVTVLYVDSLYGITPLYPTSPETDNRLIPGALWSHRWSVTTIGSTTGLERILVLSVPARGGFDRVRFTELMQPHLAIRSPSSQHPLMALLDDAINTPSRGPGRVSETGMVDGAMQVLTLRMLPEPGP